MGGARWEVLGGRCQEGQACGTVARWELLGGSCQGAAVSVVRQPLCSTAGKIGWVSCPPRVPPQLDLADKSDGCRLVRLVRRQLRLPWISDGMRRKWQYGQRPCRGQPRLQRRQAARPGSSGSRQSVPDHRDEYKTGLAVRRPELVWPQQAHPPRVWEWTPKIQLGTRVEEKISPRQNSGDKPLS